MLINCVINFNPNSNYRPCCRSCVQLQIIEQWAGTAESHIGSENSRSWWDWTKQTVTQLHNWSTCHAPDPECPARTSYAPVNILCSYWCLLCHTGITELDITLEMKQASVRWLSEWWSNAAVCVLSVAEPGPLCPAAVWQPLNNSRGTRYQLGSLCHLLTEPITHIQSWQHSNSTVPVT